MNLNVNNPMFHQLPDGRRGIQTQDGSIIPLIDVNLKVEVSVDAVVIPGNGPPIMMPVAQALAIQQTLAAHWLTRFTASQEEIANLRAKLNESQGEGRVYELDADIHVTLDEFGDLKELEEAVAEELDCSDAKDVREFAAELRRTGSARTLPGEMEIAMQALGFTTLGGLRAFCEHYKIPVPAVARG